MNAGSAAEVLGVAPATDVASAAGVPQLDAVSGRTPCLHRLAAIRYSSPSRAHPGALFSIDPSERMKTYVAKPSTIEKKWYVVDAKGKTLGRLATVVADTLRGKRKPIYTPNIDTGDFVVIINAEKIVVTGKKPEQKMYYRHSGYPGGLKEESFGSSSRAVPKRSSVAP